MSSLGLFFLIAQNILTYGLLCCARQRHGAPTCANVPRLRLLVLPRYDGCTMSMAAKMLSPFGLSLSKSSLALRQAQGERRIDLLCVYQCHSQDRVICAFSVGIEEGTHTAPAG